MPVSPRDLLVLSRVTAIGPARLRALVSHFGDAASVARATPRQLIAVEGIERKTASLIASFFRSGSMKEAERFADDQLARLSRLGGAIISFWDREYPSLLKKTFDPPPFLFIRGNLEERDNLSLAVVGTREPSPYGVQMTERFASGLAGLGITVVSGLARGIDTVAHGATLRAGHRTIAVIGSGLDIVYPTENQGLAARITSHGALLSEFPLGTKPDAVNFPRRNRIVSGMTLGTLVVETGPEGGAMITAHLAVEQSREVFAVPSSVSNKKSSGTNLLIKEGKAKLTETVDDILAELAPRLRGILPRETTPRREPQEALTLFEQRILDAMDDSPLHIDALAGRAGLAVSDALVHLLALEFKGVVRQSAGKMFARI
ncbi:MAG: DNA-processing protein DprA [Bacteroidota bacterium]